MPYTKGMIQDPCGLGSPELFVGSGSCASKGPRKTFKQGSAPPARGFTSSYANETLKWWTLKATCDRTSVEPKFSKCRYVYSTEF